jgi:hypothetical protein
MLLAATLAALLQGGAPAPADTADAFLDPAARSLVAGARERRLRVERTIDAYTVTARQRMYAGISAASRDRTLFGGELAARIEWRRDTTGHVRLLGAREASPAATGGATLPDDFRGDAIALAFNPDELQLNLFTFGMASAPDAREASADTSDGGERSVSVRVTPVDPLSPGAEAHYRYRAADTTTIRLPDGSRLRLVRLEILPRRREFRLLRGSLWIDTETFGVARSVLTTARPFSVAEDTETRNIPRVVRPLTNVRASVRYVTVEYALHQGRFWLPRLVAMDGEARILGIAGVPVRFERSYDDYRVVAAATVQRAALPDRSVRADTAARRACQREAQAAGETSRWEGGECRRWRVEVPADSMTLLTGPELPVPLSGERATLITGEEVESLARVLIPSVGRIGDLLPETTLRVGSPGLMRYNRVEGLSIGALAAVRRGPYAISLEPRLGLADLEPQAELALTRESLARRAGVTGYRRLATFDPTVRESGLGASLNALLLGRDEAEYLLASGVELTSVPLRHGRWSWSGRLFGEHQHPVTTNTQLSLARAWDDRPFRPVRPADRADQLGASLALARGFGSDRSAARLTVGAWTEGQAGTFGFARGRATAGLTAPRVGRFALALEGSAGSSLGEVPVQGLWYLGGPATVRGYPGSLVGGETFWRARGEVGTAFPAARLVLFSDAGWAGARDGWRWDPPLLSAGAGASFLDGLVRIDLSRALRSPVGWRVDLYLDAAL